MEVIPEIGRKADYPGSTLKLQKISFYLLSRNKKVKKVVKSYLRT
jgi:hypothetical protein